VLHWSDCLTIDGPNLGKQVNSGEAVDRSICARNRRGLCPKSRLIIVKFSVPPLYRAGKAVTAENREAYRQNFSVVFSDFCLFDSLLGIELLGLDEKARDYLIQLQLDHKVRITGGELSTTDLSQGQRKRLALLTAYLEDRPIYVFDEWAADQDPLFKDIFYNQLLTDLKRKGKTILVISHDEQYYYRADRIVKLSQGRLVDDSRTHQAAFTSAD
jgi:putative ATP-binding cassette transporter